MGLIFLFILIILLWIFIFSLIIGLVHRSQTLDFSYEYSRGTIFDFLVEFKKRSWTITRSGVFLASDSKISADMIDFDGVSMLLPVHSYWIARIVLKLESRRRNKAREKKGHFSQKSRGGG